MPGGTERILVVEDDPHVRAGFVRQLQSLGYVVDQAPDGTAGVLAFQAASQSYDLLLTDVVTPGPLNGKALADEVARRWPTTKLVFMSGYTENAIVHYGRLDPGVLLIWRKSFGARLTVPVTRPREPAPPAHRCARNLRMTKEEIWNDPNLHP